MKDKNLFKKVLSFEIDTEKDIIFHLVYDGKKK